MCSVSHSVLMHRMRWWQVNAACRGLARRDRSGWETTRMLIFSLGCMFSAEGQGPRTVQDILTFPWERKNGDDIAEPEINEEALRKLLDECRAHNEKVAG